MNFKNIPPKWDEQGTEPSAELQEKGFTAGYKPPAPYFNYLFNKISACLRELQDIVGNKRAPKEKWACVTTVGKYSRICKLNGYANYLLTIRFKQNGQAVQYTYTVGVGYSSAYVTQIASTGHNGYPNIQVRVVTGSYEEEHFVEVLNAYGADGATTVKAVCTLSLLSGDDDISYTTFTDYTPAENGAVRATVTSQPKGLVSSTFYGDLVGNADTATKLKDPMSLKLGNTRKNVDGSKEVSFTPTEMGYRHDWAAIIRCATWSRLCYVEMAQNVIGAKYLLNIGATRNQVVINDTFLITTHHSKKAHIVKLGGGNYNSGHKIRVITNDGGNNYVELYDDLNGATADTEQTVFCRLIPIYTGNITPYTDFTDGSTIPANFYVGQELEIDTTDMQGDLRGGLYGNASTATALETGRFINDILFNGTKDITLGLKSTVSVVSNDNTKNYHRILSSGVINGTYIDRSIVVMASGNYEGGNFGIFKVTVRTKENGENSKCILEWFVRKGIEKDQIVCNMINTFGATEVDVFFRSAATYSGLTFTVLSEGDRARSFSTDMFKKINTHTGDGIEVYTKQEMAALKAYTDTFIQGEDVATVNTANIAINDSRGNKITENYTPKQNWYCVTKIGEWSRLCKITGYGSHLLNVGLTQSNQAVSHTYIVGTGYSSANIAQIGSTGHSGNAEIQLRVVTGAHETEHFVEILNTFASDPTLTNITAECTAIKIDKDASTLVTFTDYTATTEGAKVKATITSKYKGIVAENIYDGSGNEYLNQTDVVDNLLSTAANLPLSANQGRILGASASNPFENKASVTNIDNIPTAFTACATTESTLGTFPDGFNKIGVILPIRRTSTIFFQIYIDIYGKMATRAYSNGWETWDIKVSQSQSSTMILAEGCSGNTEALEFAIPNFNEYNMLFLEIYTDLNYGGLSIAIPKALYSQSVPFAIDTSGLSNGYYVRSYGYIINGKLIIRETSLKGWTKANIRVFGIK